MSFGCSRHIPRVRCVGGRFRPRLGPLVTSVPRGHEPCVGIPYASDNEAGHVVIKTEKKNTRKRFILQDDMILLLYPGVDQNS